MTDEKCLHCGGKMLKNFSNISGNAKYVMWKCEDCGYTETKCLGVVPKDGAMH